MIAAFKSDVNLVISLIYMISWIFIGKLSLLNLFLAILLDGFSTTNAELDLQEMEDAENVYIPIKLGEEGKYIQEEENSVLLNLKTDDQEGGASDSDFSLELSDVEQHLEKEDVVNFSF